MLLLSIIPIILVVQVAFATAETGDPSAQENALIEQQQQHQADFAAAWPPMEDSWNYWWTYSALSGPSYWGVMNTAWFVCHKGKRQSPIDIRTVDLIFDPSLTPLKIDNNLIWAAFYNDGHAIVLNRTDNSRKTMAQTSNSVNNNADLNAPTKSSNQTTASNKQSLVNEIDAESARLEATKDMISSLLNDDTNDDIFADFKMGSDPDLTSETYSRLSSWIPAKLNNGYDDNPLISRQTRSKDDHDPGASHGTRGQRQTNLFEANNQDQNSQVNQLHQQQQQQINGDNNNINSEQSDKLTPIKFSGAGLPYSFEFERLYLRFGTDSSKNGSEHQLNGRQFAAELQILAYNSELYSNFQEASMRPLGLLAISVFIETAAEINNKNHQLGNNKEFFSKLDKIKFRGESSDPLQFNVSDYLPNTDQFVTYEGSLTIPGCYETVTWIIMNKPMYITGSQLESLRTISGDDRASSSGKLIAGNVRPVQATNGRPIRTNIKPTPTQENSQTCRKMWNRYEYKIS